MAIGSSLTTSATLGVAFIGVASAIDASLAITAGAIVSGAFLVIKCHLCPIQQVLRQ